MKHTNTVKEGNAFTGGEWYAKEGQIYPLETGKTLALIPYFDPENEEQQANARLIAESKNLFKIVGELIQYLEWREDFLIEDSEEGETNVYTQAKAIINRINNQ